MYSTMPFFHIFHWLILVCLPRAIQNQALSIKPQFYEKNMQTCMKLAKQPYFEIDLVIGKPWRIYFTWNLKLETKCLDMVFKNASIETVNRIWTDMNEYLEQQPAWEAATLSLTMGSAMHELLLFADNGPAGSFVAVPNVIREGNLLPTRKEVPLLKFQIKLLREGKFLLLVDCHVGGASLAARPDNPPFRSEIASTIADLDIGDGFPACIKERNKDEQFVV